MTSGTGPAFAAHARQHWRLDSTLTFLNHGSFGACPTPVLEYQSELRDELERSPVQFMVRRLPELLAHTRERVASFLKARPQDVVFVNNATSGVNAVLRSIAFERGDEVLTTNHTYAACANALQFVAKRHALRVIVAQIPFPLASASQITETIVNAATPKTRLALLDHVTSISGLVWPVADIVSALEQRGVATLIDGAHAPGMVDIDLERLGASYYAANFHKWLCAPKGAGLLWAREDRQPDLVPLTVSHGYATQTDRFAAMFDWQGTQDPTAVLCVPRAMDVLAGLVPGGWPDLRRHNRALALEARDILCQALELEQPAPDAMIGALCSIPVHPAPEQAKALYEKLLASGFEVLVAPWSRPAASVLRVSAQIYNTREQYQQLARALPTLLAEG